MIKGVHTTFYGSEPEALGAFLRDRLELPYTDVGGGWLILDLSEADVGCHPAGETSVAGQPAGTHNISFYCDDIDTSVASLASRSVEFIDSIDYAGHDLATYFLMPGDIGVQLYHPHHRKT